MFIVACFSLLGAWMGSRGMGETRVPQCGEQGGPQASGEGLAWRSHASVSPETGVGCTRVWSVGQATAAGHRPQCLAGKLALPQFLCCTFLT